MALQSSVYLLSFQKILLGLSFILCLLEFCSAGKYPNDRWKNHPNCFNIIHYRYIAMSSTANLCKT